MNRRGLSVVLVVVATMVGLFTGCDPAAATDPVYFSNTPIASWRLDGVGWATEIVGDTLYVGGTFSNVTSPNGATVTPRANLAAFSLSTGALLPAFRADTNGAVRSLAYDGTRLFVGGSFTTLNGISRSRLAAVSPTSGAVTTTWNSSVNSNVYAMAMSGSRLYLGGSFSNVRGSSRGRFAALDAATGSVLSIAPNFNNTVLSLAAAPDGGPAYVGGTFTQVNGVAAPRLAKISDAGALQPLSWGVDGAPSDLSLDPTGTRLAVSETGAPNQGSLHDTSTGRQLWRQRCDGDAQAVEVIAGTVLTGFHEACSGDTTQRLVANEFDSGTRDLDFRPTFDRFWGVRALDGNTDRLVVAGDFTQISGVAVSGFAIFTRRIVPIAPVTLSAGATWRYLDGTSAAPAGWAQPDFNDSTWRSGPAQLGYGEGDEATVLASGGLASRPITSYYRTTFTAGSIPATLTLRLVADDSALVRINGVEVVRDNLPAGTITAATRASSGRSGAIENEVRSFTLPPSSVVVGTNTIAVEVHQDSTTSSDVSFVASLTSTGSDLARMMADSAATAPTTTTTTTVPVTTTTAPPTTTTTVPVTTTTTTTAPPATNVVQQSPFAAADGAAWPGWTTSSSGGTATVRGEAGELAINDTANAYARAQLTSVASRADSDVLLSYQWSSTTASAYFSVFSRGSGGWLNGYRPQTGYGVELSSSSAAVTLKRSVSGTTTTLATVASGQTVTTAKQWLRLRVVGDQISFKVWRDGQSEPAGWQTTVTDASVTAPGQLFTSVVRSSTNVGAKAVTIDDVMVTTGS